MLRQTTVIAMTLIAFFVGTASAAPQKMIIDTDFNTIGDDGKVVIMAAQLYAQGTIDLLGVTIVAGNDWLNQETSDALKAVERLGIADKVGVYAGAHNPLVHDYATIMQEKALFGGFIGGSWNRPEPADDKLTAPLDGFATKAKVQKQHAVDFIIDTVKKYPHEVTILSIGPMTNLALAIRLRPEIVPLIKRVVFIAGAFEVPGNTTLAAEFNVWFDPEAARIVVRQPLDMTFIPLDVTNTVPMTKDIYEKIIANEDSIVTKLLKNSVFGRVFEQNTDARPYIYDTLAMGYAVDPTLATDAPDMWIDVDTSYGQGYGRTFGYPQARAAAYMQKAKVVRRFDNERFYQLFIDLLTRPVPVNFSKPQS
jgi:inosine-uridine nucleoside N-ribohydrolase